jgi:two-component system chemotaxis sensor kinase CheA
MNEFIAQFLIEGRELVEQGTADLLALEARPSDRERLDGAFRALHTLKGAAGIVEFDAMARALHAAEDALAGVRSGARPVTAGLISDCLTCLDQVEQWLDAMEGSGEVPADAEVQAQAIVGRFSAGPGAAPERPPADWLGPLLARHPRLQGRARSAVRYTPGPDAFLRGEDPLALVERLPGLLALDLEGPAPQDLEDLDPFACALVVLALAEAPAEAAAAALPAEAEVRSLGAASELPDAARAVLEAQLGLLQDVAPEGLAGRRGSAVRTAANVLVTSAVRPRPPPSRRRAARTN